MASITTGYIGAVSIDRSSPINIGSTAYGVCETAGDIAAKTVEMTGFVLTTGATIFVKFTNTNTASNPSLNVNSTGAKSIKKYGTTPIGESDILEGSILCLTYDGTNWSKDFAGGGTVNYTLGTSGNNITLTNQNTGITQSITTPYATKTLQDVNGNQIDTTYAKAHNLYGQVYVTRDDPNDEEAQLRISTERSAGLVVRGNDNNEPGIGFSYSDYTDPESGRLSYKFDNIRGNAFKFYTSITSNTLADIEAKDGYFTNITATGSISENGTPISNKYAAQKEVSYNIKNAGWYRIGIFGDNEASSKSYLVTIGNIYIHHNCCEISAILNVGYNNHSVTVISKQIPTTSTKGVTKLGSISSSSTAVYLDMYWQTTSPQEDSGSPVRITITPLLKDSSANTYTLYTSATTENNPSAVIEAKECFTNAGGTMKEDVIFNNAIRGKEIANTNNVNYIFVQQVPHTTLGSSNDSTYYMLLTRWLCEQYPNKNNVAFFMLAQPNSHAFTIIYVYDTSAVDSNGNPEYAAGFENNLGTLYSFSFQNYQYSWKGATLNASTGVSYIDYYNNSLPHNENGIMQALQELMTTYPDAFNSSKSFIIHARLEGGGSETWTIDTNGQGYFTAICTSYYYSQMYRIRYSNGTWDVNRLTFS